MCNQGHGGTSVSPPSSASSLTHMQLGSSRLADALGEMPMEPAGLPPAGSKQVTISGKPRKGSIQFNAPFLCTSERAPRFFFK